MPSLRTLRNVRSLFTDCYGNRAGDGYGRTLPDHSIRLCFCWSDSDFVGDYNSQIRLTFWELILVPAVV